MSRPRVYLTGGDQMNWALDDDLRLTRRALEGNVEFTDLDRCDVVHSVWWEGLLKIPPQSLVGKRVVCHLANRPFHTLKHPSFRRVAGMGTHWIAVSSQAARELASVGMEGSHIPYTIDADLFRPLPPDHPDLLDVRRRWNIPTNCYLIGSFQRDTLGRDLRTPKIQKGPDIFAEIVHVLAQKRHPVHVVLAGPRRFWLRRRLTELGVPFTFVGQRVEGVDDNDVNILPRTELVKLYSLIDLYLVTSRWEGGPRGILEAGASRCKMLSTRVGLAEDVLNAECVYDSPIEAVNAVERDIQSGWLDGSVEMQHRRVIQNHRPEANTSRFAELYRDIERLRPFSESAARSLEVVGGRRRLFPGMGRLRRLGAQAGVAWELNVGIWQGTQPPEGSDGQFMAILRKALRKRGVYSTANRPNARVEVYLVSGSELNPDMFGKPGAKARKPKVVHRVSLSTALDASARLNHEIASATVLPSAWAYQKLVEAGFQPVSPVVIPYAVDPAVFNRKGRAAFDPHRRVGLVSTVGPDVDPEVVRIYMWIEQHLDWERFDYTVVGGTPEAFERIRHIPQAGPRERARILRQHDVYVCASRDDGGCIPLLEALASGLPALYLDDGAQREMVAYGGLPFSREADFTAQLDLLVEHYTMFQNVIAVSELDEVGGAYFGLLRDVAWSRGGGQ